MDTAAQVASGTTMHLSPYGLHVRHGKDSGSAEDATTSIDSSTTMDAGTPSDASSSSDAPTDAGYDASGCTTMMYQVSVCANRPPQLQCPAGTFTLSCTDNMGSQGFKLVCCPNDGG